MASEFFQQGDIEREQLKIQPIVCNKLYFQYNRYFVNFLNCAYLSFDKCGSLPRKGVYLMKSSTHS